MSKEQKAVDVIETKAEIPYELAPERIEVEVRFSRGGRTHNLVHVFNGLPDRHEQMLLLKEATKKREDDDYVQFIGDALVSFAKTHDRLLIDAQGYQVDGKSAPVEQLREKIFPNIKRSAIQALMKFDVVNSEPDTAPDALDLMSGDSEDVEFTAMQNGKLCRMKHIFKEVDPFTLSSIGKGRKFKSLDGGRIEYDSLHSAEQAEEIYDAHVLRVEGYSFKGEPLQRKEIADWKRRIPIMQKLAAVNTLRARIVSTEKN